MRDSVLVESICTIIVRINTVFFFNIIVKALVGLIFTPSYPQFKAFGTELATSITSNQERLFLKNK